MGIGICHDLRFPELGRTLVKDHGAEVLVFPAAFSLPTGALHWDVLRRCRAVDTQAYLALCSPARNIDDRRVYQPWGGTSVVDPWGQVLVDSGFEETILYCDIDLNEVHQVRTQMPYLMQQRADLYELSPLIGK